MRTTLEVHNRFGEIRSSGPLPGGRGSVFTANTRRAKPSRDREGAVGGPDPRQSPGRLSAPTLALLLAAAPLGAAELKPATAEAFEQYIRATEKTLEERREFLWCDESAERARRARQGEVVVEPAGEKAERKIRDGVVHDWAGCVFIPGATLDRTLTLVQDYDRHKQVYRPEVTDSKLLSRNGDDFRVYLRLLKKKVITVELATEHDVRYFRLDAARARSRSYSTRIAEVENAGKPGERTEPPGTGHGFLWRLDSYWRFLQRDGGVWVECEAVSLTRDVPAGLGWLIEPIIRNLPRESLANTLRATRAALEKPNARP